MNERDLLAGLGDDVARISWADAAVVRRRGDDRSRRSAVAVMVSVIVLIGLVTSGTWTLAHQRGAPPVGPGPVPTTEPPPTTQPPPTTGPPTPGPRTTVAPDPDGLLTEADLGPGFAITGDEILGDWRLEYSLQFCEDTPPAPSYSHRTNDGVQRILTGGDVHILQEVESYESTWAATAMREWRERIAACPRVGTEADGYTRITEMTSRRGDDDMIKLRVDEADGDLEFVVITSDDDRLVYTSVTGIETPTEVNQVGALVREALCRLTGCIVTR
jgi:hypothetical protein